MDRNFENWRTMAARFEIRPSRLLRHRIGRSKRFYVATIGNNNEVLQTSEMLNSHEACITNIEAMRKLTGMIPTKDLTK